MQLTQALIILASTAMAAPMQAADKAVVAEAAHVPNAAKAAQFPPAGVPDWTMEGVKRVCDAKDNLCTWTWNIKNPAVVSKTPIKFVTKRNGNTPASLADGAAQTFGDFTLTSKWNPGKWTNFGLVENKHHTIAFPAYNDEEVKGGKTVTPDRKYTVYKP